MEREEDLDTVVAKLVDQVANFNIQRFRCAIEIKVKSQILNLFIFVFMSFSSLFGVGIQVSKELNLFMKAVIYIYKLVFFHWQHLLLEAVSYRQSLTKNHMSSIEIEAKVIWTVNLLKLYLITTKHARNSKWISVHFTFCFLNGILLTLQIVPFPDLFCSSGLFLFLP